MHCSSVSVWGAVLEEDLNTPRVLGTTPAPVCDVLTTEADAAR